MKAIGLRKMTADPGVRSGKSGDAPECAAILNAWIDATPWMPRCHPRDDVMRHYREVVFRDRDVLVIGTPVLAYIALDGQDFVTALFSARPGAGYGKVLLDQAKALRSKLSLWTFVANKRAQRFYLREGFHEEARSDGDNEEGLPDILFHWEAS